ncbi:hypothetical protein GC174_17800 [bacterium]|nr:hypothetical protein [bacterium]
MIMIIVIIMCYNLSHRHGDPAKMPRRPQLHEEEIHAAADQLAAEGKDVSALELLNAIGGGSLTTIYKHLASWKKSQPPFEKSKSADIPDQALSAFHSAWRVARLEANQETEAIRLKAADDVKAAERQLTDAISAISRLEKESEADAKIIEELNARIAKTESALQKSQSEAAASKSSCDQLKEQVKSLESQSKTDKKERDSALKEAAKLQGQVEALQEQNAKLLASLKTRPKSKKA